MPAPGIDDQIPTHASEAKVPPPLRGMPQPVLRRAMQALAAAERAGFQTSISRYGGVRTRRMQQRLYAARAQNPNPVARPGESVHEHGMAMDVASGGDLRQQRKLAAILAPYGWQWAGPVDPVHFDYVGTESTALPAGTGSAAAGGAGGAGDAPPSAAPAPPEPEPGEPAPPAPVELAAVPSRSPLMDLLAQHGVKTGSTAPPVRPAGGAAPAPRPQPARKPAAARGGLMEIMAAHGVTTGSTAPGVQIGGKPFSPPPPKPALPSGLGAGADWWDRAKAVLSTSLRAGMSLDDAVNGVLDQIGTQIRQIPRTYRRMGLTPSWTPQGRAQIERDLRGYGQAAQTAMQRERQHGQGTPPRLLRNALGMRAGKTNRAAYDAAALADYLIGGTMAPSNLVLGPLWERVGVPAVKGAARLTGEGAARLAEAAPGLAERGRALSQAAANAAAPLGQAARRAAAPLGLGRDAGLLRELSVPLRHEVNLRMAEAAEIRRELERQSGNLARSSAAYRTANQAFKAEHGGVSALTEAVDSYLFSPGAGMTLAKSHGIPAELVERLGTALKGHADETARLLERNRIVAPGTLTQPGAARNAFLRRYSEQALGIAARQEGEAITGRAVTGTIGAVRQSAGGIVMEHAARTPGLSEAVSAASPLKAGWEQLPQEARFGAMAGRQAPAPVARLLKAAVAPEQQGLEKEATRRFAPIWRSVVRSGKGIALTGNVGGLVRSLVPRLALAETAAQRLGLPTPEFVARSSQVAPSVVKDLYAFWRYGTISPELKDAMQRMPGFLAHFGTQMGEPGQAPAGGLRLFWERLLSAGGQAHGALDQFTKLLTYRALRAAGKSPQRAAAAVERHLFNYEDQGTLFEALNRNGLWPFNAWPVKTTGLMLRTLAERPALVYRYPRLAHWLRSEQPDTTAAARNLPPFEQGEPMLIRIGKHRFVNTGELTPFGTPLAVAAQGLHHFLGAGEAPSEQTPLDWTLAHVFFGPAADIALANRQAYSGLPVTQPGAPERRGFLGPWDARRSRALAESLMPGTLRDAWHAVRSRYGVDVGPGAYSENVPAWKRVIHGLTGLTILDAESQAAKQARLAPVIQQRAAAVGDFARRLENQPVPLGRNPYRRQAAALKDSGALVRRYKQVQEYGRQQTKAADNFDRRGNLTAEGKERVRKTVLLLQALLETAQRRGWAN